MTSVEKLIQKIERDIGIQGLLPENFRRTRAGRHLLAAGAWSWEIRYKPTGADIDRYIGSIYPVSAFTKKNVVVQACDVRQDSFVNEIEIVPDEE